MRQAAQLDPFSVFTSVTSVRFSDPGYLVRTDRGDWHCDAVVIASGACNIAAVPAVVAEGASTAAAVRRSEQLIGGARLRVFGVCAVIWALAWTLPFACGVQHEGVVTLGWILVYLLARALDTSLAAVLAATTYSHLLERPQA